LYYNTKSYRVYSLNTVYYKIFLKSYETVLRIEQCSILNTSLSWPFIFIQSKLSIWGLHICISSIINARVTLKHMVLAKHGRLLKYWCGKACCNLIKIWSLIAPDYVAHNFKRDIAKPGAVKDRILIRLSLLLHWKKKKIYGIYREGGRGNYHKKDAKHNFYSYLDLPFSALLVSRDVLQKHFFVLSKVLSSSSS